MSQTQPGYSGNRLASIFHTRSGVPVSSHSFTYDSPGHITNWEQEASGQTPLTWRYGYNLRDELVSAEKFETANPNTVLDRQAWALDNAGNWLSHTTTAMGNHIETRTHDVLNRLVQRGGGGTTAIEGTVSEDSSVLVNGQPAEARVAPAGNGALVRFRKVIPVTPGANYVTITATDATQQTTTKTWKFYAEANERHPYYDANGNMLADGYPDWNPELGYGGDARLFEWDAKNRLKAVTVIAHGTIGNYWGSTLTRYRWDYDYRDRRVREWKDTQVSIDPIDGSLTWTNSTVPTRLFVWDGNDLVQEQTATSATAGSLARNHFFGGFADGTTVANSVKYQTTTDHLGNIRDVLTTTGTLAARYDYTPYQGPVKVGTTTVDPSILTIGRYYHHAASGLELALYRAYDAELGRWISEDPLEEEGGLNLHAYVGNGPISHRDGLGLFTLQLGLAVDWNIGPVSLNFSVGIAFDGHGNVGCYRTIAVGGGLGGGVSGGVSVGVSDGDTIDDLADYYSTSSADLGAGVAGSVQKFEGPGSKGQMVTGGGCTVGVGMGAGASTGISYTQIVPLTGGGSSSVLP